METFVEELTKIQVDQSFPPGVRLGGLVRFVTGGAGICLTMFHEFNNGLMLEHSGMRIDLLQMTNIDFQVLMNIKSHNGSMSLEVTERFFITLRSLLPSSDNS